MKSLVKDALSRENPERTYIGDDKTDQELQEILKGLRTKIYIIGLGGAGCNTVNRLYDEGIHGAELIAANTDAQHLLSINANRKILLGRNLTRGLGAGARPEMGEKAAIESMDKFKEMLQGADIVFLTCGLGGGTGTGSIGPISEVAKECGALTISIMTTPFSAEGKSRSKNAVYGIRKIKNYCDTVITVPNDRLLELVPRLPLNKAFKVADEVLMRSIKGLTEMITKPGLVNLDYNDLRTIMEGAGLAMIGMGESEAVGDARAREAIEQAVNSPLLDVDISGATGALINVSGGNDMSVREAEMVAEVIENMISPDAKIIWGCNVDPTIDKKLRVMVVATGIKSKQITGRILSTSDHIDSIE